MTTTLEQINAHLAAIADLARQQQQTIEQLSAPVQPPPQPSHRFGAVIHFSDRPADYPLKTNGLSAVRGWISLAADGTVKPSDLAGARLWRDAGYYVIACIHPSSPSRVTGVLIDQWAAHLTVGAAGVDLWEVGNECDLSDYWLGGNWREAVERFIVPMCRALRERLPEAKIIPGALGSIAKQSTYEADYAAALRPLGSITVGQAVHPYSTTAADLQSKLKRMAATYTVPLYATEWDIGRGRPDSEWFRDVDQAARIVRDKTAVDCFYRIKDGNSADRAGRNLYGVDNRLTDYGKAYFEAVKAA